MDILNESSVAQDILLAKNKVFEEGNPDEIPQSDSDSLPEQQIIEQPSAPSEPVAGDQESQANQDEMLAKVLDNFREFSPEKPEEAVPEETLPKETPPKITKSTFENIPVYGSVPEELLETHLCLDQKLPPEVHDSFAAVPDSLLNRFEVDSPPLAGQFVQTQDAALAIRKKEGK